MQEPRKWIPILIVLFLVLFIYTVWCLREKIKSLFNPSKRSRTYEQEELLTQDYQIERQIACGHYGRIFCGKIKEESACFKQINDKATFEKERHMMAKLRNHENIVHLIGSVASEKHVNPLLIMHLFTKGDLSRYLSNGNNLSRSFKFDAVKDILNGMKFVHANNIWHLDLAARNCLVTDENRIKIGDFGNATYSSRWKQELPAKVNYRWMPPEVLRKQKITSKTDVWSFGVVIHEICCAGKLPWPNLPILEDLPRAAEMMETEELPEYAAAPEINQLMRNCLKNYKYRPAFHKLNLYAK